jgi:hypothetical protein
MIRLVLLVTLASAPLSAQITIRTEPEQPARGSLIRLYLSHTGTEPLTSLTAEAEGEPLHLVTTDQVTWVSYAPIAVEGGDTVPVTVHLNTVLGSQTVQVPMVVRQSPYPSEKLTVAP